MGSLMAGWDSPTLDPESGKNNKCYPNTMLRT